MPAYKEENGTWTAKFKYTNAANEKNKRGFDRNLQLVYATAKCYSLAVD